MVSGISYDDENRVSSTVSLVDNKGFITEYTYNDKGLLTAVKSSAANESGKTSGGMEFSKTNSYDALGRLLNSKYNTTSELTVSYTYVGDSEQGTTTTLVASVDIGGKVLSYTYDEDGNITEIKENNVLKESYSYDALGQMTRENSVDNNQTILYTYDGSGNILSKTTYPYTVGEITAEGTVVTYTYGNENWGDLLTAYNGEAITYDEIGNPLKYRGGMSFGWDGGRKLTSFSTPNAVGNYVYNADGIRVYKEVNGNTTEYYLNGTEIETEITNFGGVTRRVDYIYDENGSIYGFVVDNTAKYYYTKNLQGDVIGILDASGTQIVEYSYDAWGKATVSYPNTSGLTDAEKQARYLLGSNNPFRYRGYYFDNETGFYYLNSRYYDPEVGRFISVDNAISGTGESVQGYNLFAYCFNNPVNMSDPTGNWPSWNDIKAGFKKAVEWVNNNIIQPVVDFVEDVVEDFDNYDSNNQSEDVVFSSNYFSNYNGALVVKTPFDASFSFGFIGLSTYQQDSDTLKHEYGHIVQYNEKGILKYTTDVAIPSVTINMLDRQGKLPYDYYSYPWEAEANQLGGATLYQRNKPSLPQGEDVSYWDLIVLFFN